MKTNYLNKMNFLLVVELVYRVQFLIQSTFSAYNHINDRGLGLFFRKIQPCAQWLIRIKQLELANISIKQKLGCFNCQNKHACSVMNILTNIMILHSHSNVIIYFASEMRRPPATYALYRETALISTYLIYSFTFISVYVFIYLFIYLLPSKTALKINRIIKKFPTYRKSLRG